MPSAPSIRPALSPDAEAALQALERKNHRVARSIGVAIGRGVGDVRRALDELIGRKLVSVSHHPGKEPRYRLGRDW